MVSEAKSRRLFIGTSGWSYKHWSEIFYPKDIKPDKYLEYYITRFTCVELNSCFYHLPLKTTVTGWMNRTPESFRFCTKLSRVITHELKLVNIEGALKNYFDVFESMKSRLGPVLIQLPPGLSFDKTLIHEFLDIIKNQYSLYRFAVEVRHESWINDNFFDLLAHRGIAFVIADSGNRFPFYETVTADFVYMRFHGREQLYASDYSEADLKLYAGKIISWLDEDKEVWVFFNNDFHGYAVNNAVRLREMIYIL
ncbi:MAG: DUF72 domain-containing protein [Bacteroidales bacterium]|jgi:uncharacterized protein YecE (DUF72 family)